AGDEKKVAPGENKESQSGQHSQLRRRDIPEGQGNHEEGSADNESRMSSESTGPRYVHGLLPDEIRLKAAKVASQIGRHRQRQDTVLHEGPAMQRRPVPQTEFGVFP